MARPKKYFTEEERKAAKREQSRKSQHRWVDKNPDYKKEWRKNNPDYDKDYYENHKDERLDYNKDYYSTPHGRAYRLVANYKRHDKEANRDECTITPEWIVENIFTKPCHYCGETDWTKLGCDRIDNTKPHSPDNVVCCCEKCNKNKHTTPYEEYLQKIKDAS